MSSRVVKGTTAAAGSPWVVSTTLPLAASSRVRRISARASPTGINFCGRPRYDATRSNAAALSSVVSSCLIRPDRYSTDLRTKREAANGRLVQEQSGDDWPAEGHGG